MSNQNGALSKNQWRISAWRRWRNGAIIGGENNRGASMAAKHPAAHGESRKLSKPSASSAKKKKASGWHQYGQKKALKANGATLSLLATSGVSSWLKCSQQLYGVCE